MADYIQRIREVALDLDQSTHDRIEQAIKAEPREVLLLEMQLLDQLRPALPEWLDERIRNSSDHDVLAAFAATWLHGVITGQFAARQGIDPPE